MIGELVDTIAKNKSVSREVAEKVIFEMMGDTEKVGVIIPENYESCKYLVSNGLGNEDGILYIECSCTQKSIKFICEDE
jgi:hypothetical protein